MMRNNTASSMQKTYDECYLKCSTAVYFEDQNNEAEALRSWRSALDQIYYHNAYRVPPHYRPRSETEKALQDSLRDMEMQCKERVDLLDALRQSRIDASKGAGDGSSDSQTAGRSGAIKTPRQSSESDRGLIGQGTIPAATYPDLSHPGPPRPQRPSMAPKKSSTAEKQRVSSIAPSVSSPTHHDSSRPSLPVPPTNSSRSSSPDKKSGLLTTLRTGKDGKRRSPRSSAQRKESGVAASKAATQAWSTLPKGRKDALGRSHGENPSSSTVNALRGDDYGPNLLDRTVSGESSYGNVSAVENSPLVGFPNPADYTSRANGVRNGSRPSGHAHLRPNSQQDGDERRPSLQSQSIDDLINLDPPEPPAHRSVHSPVPASSRRPVSPVRPSTASYEWPSYQTRDASATPRRPAPPAVKSKRAQKPSDPMDLPVRQRSAQRKPRAPEKSSGPVSRKPLANSSTPRTQPRRERPAHRARSPTTSSDGEQDGSGRAASDAKRAVPAQREQPILADSADSPTSSGSDSAATSSAGREWKNRVDQLLKHLPKGVDETAAKQIFNEIVVKGDEVHWDDVAGLDVAKSALKEAVVYPFLRPDLFMGLREPARGMLLFGPPGTGKTMLARAVATESRSTFFSISASSLTSKYLGESEKLVRALFALAKALAPSIIFVDEIDSLLSSRSGAEHEATRRIKTEFLIQWSDLARAAAGREQTEREREKGDASRVLVLAATNLPWMIDEAARRRFVRRQYIPLPEDRVRASQLRTLLGHQKHGLDERDIDRLTFLTDGFSGSDITALAKDAAMGPLRSLGEALLHMAMDEIRPIQFQDFEASLVNIRPSVSKQGLKQFEDWAREFGERGG